MKNSMNCKTTKSLKSKVQILDRTKNMDAT